LSETPKGYISADQNVLYVTCLNKIGFPVKYNIASFVFDLPDRKPYLIYPQNEFDEAKNNHVIIHYAAPYKPWLYYGLKYDAQWFS
jgi:lipopolysaccharide biosynthesis glycosyltransferase